MDIYINDDKIDFELENEKNIGEVTIAIAAWASSQNVSITELSMNGKSLDLGDEAVRIMPLPESGDLRVRVVNNLDLHIENVQLLHQYISLLEKCIEAGNGELLVEIITGNDSIHSLLAGFLNENPDSPESVSLRLRKKLNALDPANLKKDEKLFHEISEIISNLSIIINDRIKEMSDPFGELKAVLSLMKPASEDINNISVLLQTGRDREAIGHIIRFTELNQKMLRIYPFLMNSGIDFNSIEIDGNLFPSFYNELNGLLNELTEAFSVSDSVLVGDLLEYEISPRMNSLIKALEKIEAR